MFDPGVIGTLVVGLDNVRAQAAAASDPTAKPMPARPPRFSAPRAFLARRLRALADRLQPAGDLGPGVARA